MRIHANCMRTYMPAGCMHRDKHPRLSLADMHPLQTSYMSPDGFLASSVDVLAEAPSFSRLRAAIFQRSMPQGDAAHATTLGSQQESICHVVFNTRWHEPRLRGCLRQEASIDVFRHKNDAEPVQVAAEVHRGCCRCQSSQGNNGTLSERPRQLPWRTASRSPTHCWALAAVLKAFLETAAA